MGDSERTGSSTHASSNGFHGTTRNRVDPYIWASLQKTETCALDTLLEVLLSRCCSGTSQSPLESPCAPSALNTSQSDGEAMSEGSPRPGKTEKVHALPATATASQRLFEQCLLKVLPICDDSKFRSLIQKFSDTAGPETQRYAVFVEACNFALSKLKAVEVSGLDSSNSDVLFHVNHGRQIHSSRESLCIPDAVVVDLRAARRVQNSFDANWTTLVGDSCQKPPPSKFRWPEVLSFIEFKRSGSIKVKLRDEYDHLAQTTFPPQVIAEQTRSTSTISGTPTNSSIWSAARSNSSDSQNDNATGDQSAEGLPMAENGDPPPDDPANTHSVIQPDKQPSSQDALELNRSQERAVSRKILEGLKQCGSYASEMLSATIGRLHAFGLFIDDQKLWLWRYDRQSPIQTSGINLVSDLPRFLVLLLVFQRFSPVDWGYHPLLHSDSGSLDLKFDELDVSVDPQDVVHQTFSLNGRGTSVLGAGSAHRDAANIPLVVEFSWPNKARASERFIIREAIKGAPGAENHLPKVFASCDIHDTEEIRIQLGINENSQNPFRVLRMTVSERLLKITVLSGLPRISACMQCVKCHYLVWCGGVQHRDLSLSNMMVRKQADGYMGVLNDWDLSHVEHLGIEVNERTGTLPFLSIDLLRSSWPKGSVVVEYQHELESFVWIMFWLAMCCESDSGIVPEELRTWTTGAMECRRRKLEYLESFKLKDSPTHTLDWKVATPLIFQLKQLRLDRGIFETQLSAGKHPSVQPPTNKELLDMFLQEVPKHLPQSYQMPKEPVVD